MKCPSDASNSRPRKAEGAGNAGCWPQPMARLQQKSRRQLPQILWVAGGQERFRIGLATIQPRRIKMIKLDRTDTPAVAEHATVYLAFELSKAKWKLGVLLPGSQKLSRYTIDGGDLTALAARLADMRKKAAA